MGNIIGIPTTRVSDMFVRQRLTDQMQADQLEVFRSQMQISSGRRILLPSEDAKAALRIINLQRLLERKDQVRSNLVTNQSYLSATDSTLSTVSNSLAEIRAIAVGMVGVVADDTQRTAAAQQVQQMIRQLQDIGNRQFRGRYLFAGTGSLTQPFETADSGFIRYVGNEGKLSSYSDIDLLFETNLHGNEVFGAISSKVLGSADLNPILTYNTRLADLREGEGVTPGSISVSAGGQSSTVDITNAETIGDVAAMIRANPPPTKTLDVEIAPTGLVIELSDGSGDPMTIREVGGGTTAEELGILTEIGTAAPIVGNDLKPVLRLTTAVNDVLGTRSYALVRSAGNDNDVIFEADTVGAANDGIDVVFVDDGSVVVPGTDEHAAYDSATRTLTVFVKTNQSQARDVVRAVETTFAASSVPLRARLDPLDSANGGMGVITATPIATVEGTTAGGSGTALDTASGLQIVNGGETHVIGLAGVQTIEDILNVLNMSDAGLLAEINQNATGIDVRSRISGADFMIGENGGTTATELGLRTLTTSTRLEDLNFGNGVETATGTDLTVTIASTLTGAAANPIQIDISGLQTVGDVLGVLNAADPANLQARLATFGNGIELVDLSTGTNTLTVTRTTPSTAAIGLGLIPKGDQSYSVSTAEDPAAVTVTSAAPDSDLIFTAKTPGTAMNGVRVIFEVNGTGTAVYDAGAATLTFDLTGGPDANAIIGMLAASAADPFFSAAPAPSNSGAGIVDAQTSAPMAGGSRYLTGADTNQEETEGIFTALLRLQAALLANDPQAIERTLGLLDTETTNMNFARAELGARQQVLDVTQLRLEAEEVDLQEALSLDFDVDMIEAISEFTGRQAAYEASLRTTAQIFSMTLLNFL